MNWKKYEFKFWIDWLMNMLLAENMMGEINYYRVWSKEGREIEDDKKCKIIYW